MKRYILLFTALVFSANVWAQTKTILGKVTDTLDNSPLVGATVVAKNPKGEQKGATTDLQGNYRLINIPADYDQITFSFIGMTTMVEKIGNRTVINAVMSHSEAAIDAVVVTALGLTREARSLNYSRQGVDGEALSETRTPDFVTSLIGKVAGVQVNSAGQNTGSAGIVIRGYTSATSDNNAIFVVDGVIMENNVVGGERGSLDYGNGMGDINPADIESIEVLKGPNAAALYGSRASNGVIMITTKKSAGKGLKATFSNSTMFQRIGQYPEYQNTFGVGMDLDIQTSNIMDLPNPITGSRYRSWGPMMLGQPYMAIDGTERPYLPQPDNIRDFYQTSTLMTNMVTIEGGNSDNNTRLSYTNYIGNSVVDNINNQLKNTLTLNQVNKFASWLRLDSRITYIYDDVKNRQYLNSNNRNPVNTYVHMARSTSLSELYTYKDENGNEIGTNRNSSNPFWIINENPTRDTRDRLQSAFKLNVKLPYGFSLTGRAGTDFFWWEGTSFQNMGGLYDPNGRVDQFTEFYKSVTFEGMALWEKRYGKFSFNAMGGTSTNTRSSDRRDQSVIGLVQPGFIHITNTTEKSFPTQRGYKRRTNSIYGSVSVGYGDFIYLDATARNDWSSTLPANNCSYFYPSIGTSFVFSELFNGSGLKKAISLGKFRLSFAGVGNDTAPYRIAREYVLPGLFNGQPYAAIDGRTMNSPTMKPELTNSLETGLDMAFWKDRVSFDFTWYNSSTLNQIIMGYVTTTSGYERRYFNAGEIRNRGFEISLRGKPVQTKKFKWSSMVNYSKNNSKVISLLDEYDVTSITLQSASNANVNVEVGQPYGYIRGIGVKRNEYGQMIMPDGASPSEFEQVENMGFGTSSPDWLLGVSNELSWKGLSLSFLVDVRWGGIMYCNTFSKMMTNGMTTVNLDGRIGYALSKQIYNENDTEMTHGIQWPNAVQRVYGDDGVTVVGYKPVTKYFSPSGYEYTRSSINEFSIFNASYVKLRQVVLGYTLPATFVKKLPFSNIRVSLVTQNPWIIYQKTPRGVDPESASTSGNGRGIENGSLPPIATYGFNISFSTK